MNLKNTPRMKQSKSRTQRRKQRGAKSGETKIVEESRRNVQTDDTRVMEQKCLPRIRMRSEKSGDARRMAARESEGEREMSTANRPMWKIYIRILDMSAEHTIIPQIAER